MNHISESDDGQSLIGTKQTCTSKYPFLVFLLVKIAPFLTYFFIFSFLHDPSVSVVLFFISQCFEFFMIKNVCGLDLIGIKWYVEPNNDGSFLQYYAKPAPYVPNYTLSNVFWIGFIAAIILWIVTFFIDLFERNIFHILICIIGLIAQGTNLLLFMRAHAATQKNAAKVALAGLLDDTVKFNLVNDDEKYSNDDNDDDLSDDNSVIDDNISNEDNDNFKFEESEDSNKINNL